MPRKEADKSKSRTRAKSTQAKGPVVSRKARTKHPAMKKSPLFGNPAIAPVSPERPISPVAERIELGPLPLPEPVQLAAFQVEKPASHAFFDWPVGVASVLAGMAGGWQYLGTCRVFQAEIDPLPATTTMVTVIALLCLSIGMLLPVRVAALGRRFSGKGAGKGVRVDLPERPEGCCAQIEPDPFSRLALLSAACALASLLAIGLSGPMLRAYRHILDGFFWNNVTLAGLEWAFVTALVAGPCLLMGVVLSVVGTCARDSGGNRTGLARVLSGLLLGAGLAMIASTFPGWRIWAEQQVVVGTVPLFALAAGALYLSSTPIRVSPRPEAATPPGGISADALGRIAPLIWTFALVLTCAGWLACRSEAQARSGSPEAFLLGFIALSHLAAAILWRLLGCCPEPGSSVWVCGLGAGLAAMLTAGPTESWWRPGLEAVLIAVPAGQGLYAMSRIGQCRPSNQSACFTHFGVIALTGAALGLAAARWWALPQLGAMGTLAAGSLALLGLGGLLEVHGQVRPVRAEQFRLAIVFGSLAAAIVVFPALTRTWTRRENQRFVAGATDALSVEVVGKALVGVRTACLIGVDETGIGQLPYGRAIDVEVLPLASWLPEQGPHSSDDRVHLSPMPAPRALRLNRTRYQLVYQALAPGRDDPAVYCSAEWLSQLYRHAAVGGTLMLELPLAGLNRSQVRDLAATFRHASPGYCSWMLIAGSCPRLLLRSEQDPSPDRIEQAGWGPVDQLLRGEENMPRVHSIRRGSSGWLHGVQDPESAVDWLATQIRRSGPVAHVATPTGLPR